MEEALNCVDGSLWVIVVVIVLQFFLFFVFPKIFAENRQCKVEQTFFLNLIWKRITILEQYLDHHKDLWHCWRQSFLDKHPAEVDHHGGKSKTSDSHQDLGADHDYQNVEVYDEKQIQVYPS